MYNEDTIRNTITQRDKSIIINDDFLHNLETLLDDALEAKQAIETGRFPRLIGMGCLACITGFRGKTNTRMIISELRKNGITKDEFDIRSCLERYETDGEQRGFLHYYIYNEIYRFYFHINARVKITIDERGNEWFEVEWADLEDINLDVSED